MTSVAKPESRLSPAFGRNWQTLALPVAIVLIAVELQRHWDEHARWLYIACIALALTAWLGTMSEKAWARPSGGKAIDAVIFLFLIGCIVLGLGFGDTAAVQSSGQLLFWSPLLCLWWAYQYRDSLPRLIASEVALFAGLAVVHPGMPGLLLEYVLLAAIITSLAWHADLHPALPFGQIDSAGAKSPTPLDAVTNLPSPERFEDELALTVAVADRYRIPFSLLLCEIQGLAGDAADLSSPVAKERMKLFAWKVADQLRVADTLCRWEDEKFVILLPNTDAAGSQMLVDRIRRASADIFYPPGSPTALRIGVCQHRYGDDPMTTFSLAEAAMRADGAPSEN